MHLIRHGKMQQNNQSWLKILVFTKIKIIQNA